MNPLALQKVGMMAQASNLTPGRVIWSVTSSRSSVDIMRVQDQAVLYETLSQKMNAC